MCILALKNCSGKGKTNEYGKFKRSRTLMDNRTGGMLEYRVERNLKKERLIKSGEEDWME